MQPHQPEMDDTSSENMETRYSPHPTRPVSPQRRDTATAQETKGREVPSDLDYLILHKYRLIKPLGKGGMGEIYLAEHTELRKLVAIKVISQTLSHRPQFLSLFKREARSAAKLQHPNIARVFDYGQEKGKCFYVMDYVEGTSLAEIIKSSAPLPPKRALGIFKQLLDALEHAHKSGIIHRDVKPSNIVIDHNGLAKLLDFGLAKSVYGEDGLTTAGQSPGGTPSYMSPEQRRGEPTDGRTDIYSAGVTLFEMLTGTVPRDVNDPRQRLLSALSKNLNLLQRARAAHIANMVMKCLDDPSKRYTTAQKVLADLAKIERSSQRQRWFVGSAAGALAAAALTLAAVMAFSPRKSLATDAVRYLEEKEFPKAAKLFAGLSKKQPSDLKIRYGLGLSYIGMGKLDEAESQFNRIAQSLGHNTTADEEGLARVAYARNQYDTALDLYHKAVATDKPHTLIYVTIGDIYLLRNQLDRAIEEYEKALGRKPIFRFQLAQAYAGLGKAYARKGNLEQGLSSLRRAEKVLPSDAEIASAVGYVLMRKGEYDQALKAIEKATHKSPDDSLALFLKSEIARKSDAERQNRISDYVDDLIRKAEQAPPLPAEEQWESPPMTIAILDMKKAGFAFSREGEYEMLMFNLAHAMDEAGRVTVVDRHILEEILKELKLSASALADPAMALRLGRIVSARLFATGTLRGENGLFGVDLRLVETETTAPRIWLSQNQQQEETIAQFAQRLAASLTTKIREAYPLKATVVSIEGKEAALNIGLEHGLTSGTEMNIIRKHEEKVGDQSISREVTIGTLKVKAVGPRSAEAQIVEAEEKIAVHDRAIEVIKRTPDENHP